MNDEHSLTKWTNLNIAIIEHQMYNLARLPSTKKAPDKSSDGIDVFRFSTVNAPAILATRHTHLDFVEIVYVKEGGGIAVIDTQEHIIQKGDILVIQQHQFHNNIPMPNLSISNCLISASLLQKNTGLFSQVVSAKGTLDLPPIIRLSGSARLRVETLFEQIHNENRLQALYHQETSLYILNQLLILLYRCVQENSPRNIKNDLSETMEYIHEHYDTITLSEAAAISSYNPTYFSRLFYSMVGQHFTEYVNKLRVKHAMTLLLDTALPAEEICLMVGFKSKIHFYDIFRKYTGLTPGTFRRSHE